jgi:hypothetical protein
LYCCCTAAAVQLLGSVLHVLCAGAERHCLSVLVQLACGCASPAGAGVQLLGSCAAGGLVLRGCGVADCSSVIGSNTTQAV